MMGQSGRGYAFVQTSDQEGLQAAIVLVNSKRRSPIYYPRIIQTTPRRGWTALIFDGILIDQYLLRGISGRMRTQTFGLSAYHLYLSYRLHKEGKTEAAYESHLPLMVTERLRRLLAAGSVEELDLSEPAERLVLQRYHEYQHKRGWVQPSARDALPPDVTRYYTGDINALKGLLKRDMDIRYVADVLSPGFSVQSALERLLSALNLPYLEGDEIMAPAPAESGVPMQRVVGHAILNPEQWQPQDSLPQGWTAITADSWSRR